MLYIKITGIAPPLCLLAALMSTSTQAGMITTTFAGGNGQSGNMFDVNVFGNDLLVTSLDLHIGTNTSQTVELYLKSGSWIGSETTPGDWTLIDTQVVTGAGAGSPTSVDFLDFLLPKNATTALYVTLTTSTDIDYTNGTAVGSVFASNADLAILEGVGKASSFGATFTPRVWNGTVYYESNEGSVPAPATLTLFCLGLAGLGWSRRKKA